MKKSVRPHAAGLVGFALVWLCQPADAQLFERRDGAGRRILTNIRSEGTTPRPVTRPLAQAIAHGNRPARSSAAEQRRSEFLPLIEEAARAHRVPVRLVEAVVAVESNFDSRALSEKGAQGLMQLMPDTARHLGVMDPWDPASNIDGGARYLRSLLDQFDENVSLALAAYHAGPGTVSRSGGVPPIAATHRYLQKVRAELGYAVLADWASTLSAVRDVRGNLRVTNLSSRARSSLRLIEDERGRRTLTNR